MKQIPKLEQLVNKLYKEGVIKSENVKQAMLQVDRKQFMPSNNQNDAYEDEPFSIGYNATISAPHMHAYALEYLQKHLQNAKRTLDIGSGTGYLCAAMKIIMKDPQSKVIGIEHVAQLVTKSIENLNKGFQEEIQNKSIIILQGDGRLGFEQEGPYQVIHVGAAAETIPQQLLKQLDFGGRMVIPVGKGNQNFQIVDKDDKGNISINNAFGVRYIPLTDLNKQLG